MKTTSSILTVFIYIIGFKSRSSLIFGNNILPDLYWNTTNPIFMISNTDHIIDVNKATSGVGHQHDQIDIVCPKYESGTPNETMERHVIYNVNKEEYDSCLITSSSPRIIAYCTEPTEKRVFTIRFRSFSPMPNALEFYPGKSYYFISTSSQYDYKSRNGGYCVSNNMKVVFKVADKNSINNNDNHDKADADAVEDNDAVNNIINTDARAVKWKKEKSAEKSKFYYIGKDSKDIKEYDLIRESQTLRDRKIIKEKKDKMLSDEESKIYFYTTATNRVMDSNKIQGKSYHTNNYRSNEDSESILEKFSSSSSSQIKILTVSYVFMVLSLLPFTSIYV